MDIGPGDKVIRVAVSGDGTIMPIGTVAVVDELCNSRRHVGIGLWFKDFDAPIGLNGCCRCFDPSTFRKLDPPIPCEAEFTTLVKRPIREPVSA